MGMHVPCFTEIFLKGSGLLNLNLNLLVIFQKSQLRKLIASNTAEQNSRILLILSDLKMLLILLRYSKIFKSVLSGK